MLYIFDENDEYFRSPGGAFAAPGTLVLRIKTRRGESAHASVCLYPDGGGATETIMDLAGVTGVYDIYKCELKIESPGLYWYHFTIYPNEGEAINVPENPGGGFQITVHAPVANNPQWLRGGLIYHIFVDRFNRGVLNAKPAIASELSGASQRLGAAYRQDWGGCPYFLPDDEGTVRNNDFFGGNIYGIIEKLPYLEQLGVTCIYLSPVFEAASNHKYDTGDYMKVDPAFGNDEALEILCAEAAKRGMKVILDGVFNHVGCDSRYFNKYGGYDNPGACQGEQSPYYGWFTFFPDGKYEAWWGIRLLPAIKKSSESYIEFICGENGVISHWMKKGVSGWRLDVVDELPDVFLDPLCEAVKRENSEAAIIGEVWEDASNKIAYDVRRRYFLGGQLDSVTNYPLMNAIVACVKEGKVEQLACAMDDFCKNYPAHVLDSLMNILGTHDTVRILTALSDTRLPEGKEATSVFRLTDEQLALAKKRLKLASTLQFTLPGVPCVYYGDEAGMEGGADPFNRRCYPWGDEDRDLIAWYMILSRLRSEHGCFKDGKYELVEARAGLFAFTRGHGAQRILVAVNTSPGDRLILADGFNYSLFDSEYVGELAVKAGEARLFSVSNS